MMMKKKERVVKTGRNIRTRDKLSHQKRKKGMKTMRKRMRRKKMKMRRVKRKVTATLMMKRQRVVNKSNSSKMA